MNITVASPGFASDENRTVAAAAAVCASVAAGLASPPSGPTSVDTAAGGDACRETSAEPCVEPCVDAAAEFAPEPERAFLAGVALTKTRGSFGSVTSITCRSCLCRIESKLIRPCCATSV